MTIEIEIPDRCFKAAEVVQHYQAATLRRWIGDGETNGSLARLTAAIVVGAQLCEETAKTIGSEPDSAAAQGYAVKALEDIAQILERLPLLGIVAVPKSQAGGNNGGSGPVAP